MLLKFVVVAIAVMAVSGQRHRHQDCQIDDPVFAVMEDCGQILTPSHEVMNPLKESMKRCFELYGYQDMDAHIVLSHRDISATGEKKMPHHQPITTSLPAQQMLCFLTQFQSIPEQLQRNISICSFQEQEFMDGMNFNVTAFTEYTRMMVNEAADDIPAKAYLQRGIELCPEPSSAGNMLNLAQYKKCLMGSCIQGAIEAAHPTLQNGCA